MTAEMIDHALAAEQATVGALLETTDTLRRQALDLLRDDDFADSWCRFTVSVVRAMVAERVPVDQLTVHAYVARNGLMAGGNLRGSLALFLADRCSEVPLPAALRWYSLGVVEQATRTKITESTDRITAAAGGSISDLQTVITAETAALTTLSDRLRAANADD